MAPSDLLPPMYYGGYHYTSYIILILLTLLNSPGYIHTSASSIILNQAGLKQVHQPRSSSLSSAALDWLQRQQQIFRGQADTTLGMAYGKKRKDGQPKTTTQKTTLSPVNKLIAPTSYDLHDDLSEIKEPWKDVSLLPSTTIPTNYEHATQTYEAEPNILSGSETSTSVQEVSTPFNVTIDDSGVFDSSSKRINNNQNSGTETNIVTQSFNDSLNNTENEITTPIQYLFSTFSKQTTSRPNTTTVKPEYYNFSNLVTLKTTSTYFVTPNPPQYKKPSSPTTTTISTSNDISFVKDNLISLSNVSKFEYGASTDAEIFTTQPTNLLEDNISSYSYYDYFYKDDYDLSEQLHNNDHKINESFNNINLLNTDHDKNKIQGYKFTPEVNIFSQTNNSVIQILNSLMQNYESNITSNNSKNEYIHSLINMTNIINDHELNDAKKGTDQGKTTPTDQGMTERFQKNTVFLPWDKPFISNLDFQQPYQRTSRKSITTPSPWMLTTRALRPATKSKTIPSLSTLIQHWPRIKKPYKDTQRIGEPASLRTSSDSKPWWVTHDPYKGTTDSDADGGVTDDGEQDYLTPEDMNWIRNNMGVIGDLFNNQQAQTTTVDVDILPETEHKPVNYRSSPQSQNNNNNNFPSNFNSNNNLSTFNRKYALSQTTSKNTEDPFQYYLYVNPDYYQPNEKQNQLSNKFQNLYYPNYEQNKASKVAYPPVLRNSNISNYISPDFLSNYQGLPILFYPEYSSGGNNDSSLIGLSSLSGYPSNMEQQYPAFALGQGQTQNQSQSVVNTVHSHQNLIIQLSNGTNITALYISSQEDDSQGSSSNTNNELGNNQGSGTSTNGGDSNGGSGSSGSDNNGGDGNNDNDGYNGGSNGDNTSDNSNNDNNDSTSDNDNNDSNNNGGSNNGGSNTSGSNTSGSNTSGSNTSSSNTGITNTGSGTTGSNTSGGTGSTNTNGISPGTTGEGPYPSVIRPSPGSPADVSGGIPPPPSAANTCTSNTATSSQLHNDSDIKEYTCNGAGSERYSYFINPYYPHRDVANRICMFRLLVLPGVCQVRIDLVETNFAPPIEGVCVNQYLTIQGTIWKPGLQRICGTNTDNHFYLEIDQDVRSPYVEIAVSSLTSENYRWALWVSQIDCGPASHTRAPDGCFQYFTDLEGTIKSFSFEDHQYYNDQHYRMCIGTRKNVCSVTFTAKPGEFMLEKYGSITEVPFDRSGMSSLYCVRDYLRIPNGSPDGGIHSSSHDRFCGGHLASSHGSASPSPITTKITSRIVVLEFHSGIPLAYDLRAHDPGYKVSFQQNICSRSGDDFSPPLRNSVNIRDRLPIPTFIKNLNIPAIDRSPVITRDSIYNDKTFSDTRPIHPYKFYRRHNAANHQIQSGSHLRVDETSTISSALNYSVTERNKQKVKRSSAMPTATTQTPHLHQKTKLPSTGISIPSWILEESRISPRPTNKPPPRKPPDLPNWTFNAPLRHPQDLINVKPEGFIGYDRFTRQ